MRYPYYDLYAGQFEKLIVAICSELLGKGVQEFATGPDGGRDARFNGCAQCLPSNNNPWQGKIIVQAKHTENIGEKFSDKSFSGTSKNSVLSKEMKRITNLYNNQEMNYYILFSNRKLTGDAEHTIRTRIHNEAGVPDTHLVGVEALDRYLKTYANVLKIAGIAEGDGPLRVSPDELAEVILKFSKAIPSLASFSPKAIERTKFDKKNKINELSQDYANVIIKHHLEHFSPIKNFLASPENEGIMEKYAIAVEEFNLSIISKRHDYHSFDEVLNHLYNLLVDRDSDLRENKILTRRVLFYMYWNCDIGKEANSA